jgi:hypothetical protein
MRTVPTSNGLEWDSDGSCYLDAIPMPQRNGQPLTLAQVIESSDGPMVWQPWLPEMSPHHNLKSFTGVIGVNQKSNVILRYIYKRGTMPVDGLYAIEARDELPAAIAGAVLAALAAEKLPNPPTYANTAPAVIARHNTNVSEPDLRNPARLNRADIEENIAAAIRAALDGDDAWPVPQGAVNRARFWLALSQTLWQPSTLRALGAASDLSELSTFNSLAVIWHVLRPSTTVRIGKADVHPPAIEYGSPWMESVAWVTRDIPADAARFFSGFAATNTSWTLLIDLPPLDEHYADAIAAALVREARANQVYGASGQFILALPSHLPWAQTQVAALAIHAQADGLWVAGLTASRERTASFWWQPEMTTTTLKQHTLTAQPLVHVTLAAFWHDLIVAGDEVIVTPGKAPRPPSTQPARRGSKRAADPVVVLPRRSVHYSGSREWGTVAEHDIITRRSHGVRAHLRELPERWQRSEQAEGEARDWGFVLPDGYTFVRPHIRGGHDHDPAPVVVRARGLQTLTALIA